VHEGTLPLRVGVLLGRTERALAHVVGLQDSGVVVTNVRLLAWRANGISPGLDLAEIDRIQYDRGPTDALIVLPRSAPNVPLVVMIDPTDRVDGELLVAAVRHAVLVAAKGRGVTVAAEEGEFMGIWTIRFR
jgi:hypothetical protein